MNANKVIYILESENGRVKIGITENFNVRKSTIKNISGFKVLRTFCTEPCSNPFQIESKLHSVFSEYRKCGEWFDVPFDIAVKKAKDIFSKFSKHDSIHKQTGEEMYSKLSEMYNSDNPHDHYECDSAGEVSSLIKNVRIVMERQESHPRKIAKQTELLLMHFGIPVVEDFVEPAPWEQLAIE